MGALFALGFIAFIISIGLPLMIFGIIGLRVFPKKTHCGQRFVRTMTVLSIVSLVVGSLMVALPIGFVLYIVITTLVVNAINDNDLYSYVLTSLFM